MAASFEMWSFVNKFNQLLDCGVSAEMNISSTTGKISINLCAEVETSAFLQQSNNCNNKTKLSPSKLRRRKLRRDARIRNSNARTSNAEMNVYTTPEASIIESSDAITTSEDFESVLLPATTMDRATDTINLPQVHSAVQAV